MTGRIALTGGIASGKSAVADLLAERGAIIIDADVLAREVVEPGTPGLDAIEARFGAGVLTPDGALDRAALGRIVFADPDARADLESITHPAIRERAEWLRAAAPPGSVVIDVIPLLVEAGLAGRFDTVVVVDTDEETQLARLRARNGLSREDALARLDAQASRERRLAAADLVVENTGDLDALRRRVAVLWGELTRA
ncbi:dephospho-CoA kinase [Propioniciclava coleopterorum]|uniref:dephospho-CoA kinase n=1 Tax=Propioniciclava coleopterorum TaxID=2714937 RepID=UPI001FE750C6|nr:dephospho-CoA kinase [Propioniciclava coleopterorum]